MPSKKHELNSVCPENEGKPKRKRLDTSKETSDSEHKSSSESHRDRTSTDKPSLDSRSRNSNQSESHRNRTSTDKPSLDTGSRNSNQVTRRWFSPREEEDNATSQEEHVKSSSATVSTRKKPSDTPGTCKNNVNSTKDSSSQANPRIEDFLSTSVDGSETSFVPERNSVSWRRDLKGPFLASYQLLGDSLFVRFANQVLNERASIGENGKFSNGDCVGGQTIVELMRRVSCPGHTLHPNVMVLIGTNDFLKGTSKAKVRERMEQLVSVLQQKAQRIVLLTIPPIPRLANSNSHWKQWQGHNEWLKTLNNGSTLRVFDIAPLFLAKHHTPDLTAFEKHMGYGKRRRIDLIHLNKCGLLRLNKELCQKLSC